MKKTRVGRKYLRIETDPTPVGYRSNILHLHQPCYLLKNIYISYTCGLYYPCDKPLLNQTGDALSNTSGTNYF